ncbi:MAG: hypothetical protein ACI4B5_05440, partial [Bacteroidaceae bacterium]
DSAFSVLQGVDTVALGKSEALNMEYNLLWVNIQNRLDNPMMKLEEFIPILDYYDREGGTSEKMLAYYLAGRICVLGNEYPMAMLYFQRVREIASETDGRNDYVVLYRTHSQMAEIYHHQHLYQKSYDECMEASQIAYHYQDTIRALYAKEVAIRPLRMMGRHADVVALSEECAREFERMGRDEDAVETRLLAFLSYMLCSKYETAGEILEEYEKTSGMFDEKGQIAKGMEMYYYKKGLLCLETGKTAQAENEFRRLLAEKTSLNSAEGAYRGLLQLYRTIGNQDSIGKYALLYCDTHDSVYKQVQSDDVTLLEARYNYNRNKTMAESRARRIDILNICIFVIMMLVVACIVLFFLYLRQLKKKRQGERESLKASYEEEKEGILRSYTEVKRLSEEYSREIEALRNQLVKANILTDERTNLVESVESDDGLIHMLKERLSPARKGEVLISEEEGKTLLCYLADKYPGACTFFREHRLTDKENILSTLLLLGFEDYEIRLLMSSSPSGYANRKSNISRKLFPDDAGKNLRRNIRKLAG